MQTILGSHGGRIDVDGDVVTFVPSARDGVRHTFRTSSVVGVEFRDASTLVNGRLIISYRSSGGSIATEPLTFRTGPDAPAVRAAATWLIDVAEDAALNGAHAAQARTAESRPGVFVRLRDSAGRKLSERRSVRAHRNRERQVRKRHRHPVTATPSDAPIKATPALGQPSVNDDLLALLALAECGGHPDPECSFRLRRGERAYAVIDGVWLIESQRPVRRLRGVSRRTAAPASHGDHLAAVDEGSLLITNQRVVFAGATRNQNPTSQNPTNQDPTNQDPSPQQMRTQEWSFPALAGRIDDPGQGVTMLRLSTRQQTSGFRYGPERADFVRPRLDLALADFHGERAAYIADLRMTIARRGGSAAA